MNGEAIPKVLFDGRSTFSAKNSGWERYSRELAKRLSVHVIRSWKLDQVPLLSDLVLAVRLFGVKSVVHFPTYPPLIPRKNYIYTLHDLTWWKYPETSSFMGKYFYRFLAQRAIKKCFVVVPSESVKFDLIEEFGITQSRCAVVYPGLNVLKATDELSPTSVSEKKLLPYILIVGTLEPRKNLSRFIEVFNRHEIAKQYEIQLVGRRGWGEKFPNMKIRTNISDSELGQLYRDASAFFYPSIYEGFGLPLIEAMSFGIPTFVSNITVFQEVAGNLANYFDSTSDTSIQLTLDKVLNGNYVHNPNNEKSRASEFDWNNSAHMLQNIYRSLEI